MFLGRRGGGVSDGDGGAALGALLAGTAGPAPSPRWGEGWGEGGRASRESRTPSPGSLRDPTSPRWGEVELAAPLGDTANFVLGCGAAVLCPNSRSQRYCATLVS